MRSNFTVYNAFNQRSNRTKVASSILRPKANIVRKESLGFRRDRVDSYHSSVRRLASQERFSGTEATSSDINLATVSIRSGAKVGEHTVEVMQLAKAQVTTSTTGFINTTDKVAKKGSISFTINGSTTTAIVIKNKTTLAELKDLINSQDSGVVASITNNGAENRLVISSRKSGSGHGFTINNSLTNIGGSVVAFATGQNSISGNTQDARNAHFKVDGVQFNRESNSSIDAIDGISLTLLKKGGATIAVSLDNSDILEAADEFVRDYSQLETAVAHLGSSRSFLLDRVAYGSMLRDAIQETRDSVLGATSGSGEFKRLADVGIELQETGKLQLDKKRLEAALVSSSRDVEKLFVGDRVRRGVFARLSERLGRDKVAAGTFQLPDTTTQGDRTRLIPKGRDLPRIHSVANRVITENSASSTVLRQLIIRMPSL